jgi:predicted nucleic acid-binding protein
MVQQINFSEPVFLDSACIIYFVESNREYGDLTKKIVASFITKNTPLFSSHLVLTEVLTKPFEENQPEITENYFGFFKDLSNLSFHQIDQSTAVLCAHIRAKYKFRLPDAMLLAQAIESNCKTFLTNDSHLSVFPDLTIALLSELK